MRTISTLLCASMSFVPALAQFGPGQLISGDLLLSEGSHQVKSVDVDADGDLDVVIRDQTVIVYLENLDGAGTFAPADTIFSFDPLHEFDMADLDGDGDLDLVVVFAADYLSLAWAMNYGNGNFQFPPTVILDPVPSFGALLCHDITGDGQPEVMITTDGGYVRWFVNDGGSIGVTDSVQHLGGPAASVLLAGDLDMDGDEDQLSIDWNGFVSVALNLDGTGNSWSSEMVATGFMQDSGWGTSPQLVDADGDGDLDLIDAYSVRWARNRLVEDGVWGAFDVIVVNPEPFTYGIGWGGPLGCGPLASILWQSVPWSQPIQWVTYDEQLGAFGLPLALLDTIRAVHISAADLNGDGANDLIIAERDTALIWWFENLLPQSGSGLQIQLTPFDTLCTSVEMYDLPDALPSGGQWSGPDVFDNSYQPINVGSATLTYTVQDPATGCPVSATQEIVVIELPEVTLDLPPFMDIAATPLLLNYGNHPGGTYTIGGSEVTELDPVLYGLGPLVVMYTYTDTATGCSNSASDTIYIENTTAIDRPSAQHGFNLYPNPANDQCTVAFGDDIPSNVRLSDACGRIIAQWQQVRSKLLINTATLSSGRYQVTIEKVGAVHHAILIVH